MNKKIGALLATAALGQLLSVHAADVTRYVVAKGQELQQTNATSVVNATTNQLPFRFLATVDAATAGSVLGAAVKLPNLQTRTLTNDGNGNYDFEQGYLTKALLDAGYAAGNYVWTFSGASNGTVMATNALAADNYPPAPKISNFADLQTVEASGPADIFWGAFTNGTANDFVRVELDDAGGTPLFETPALLDPAALNASNTTVQIPAGYLTNGTTYSGKLLFVKRTLLNTTAYPGANGVAGYYRQTTFPVKTLPASSQPGGRIQFTAKNYSASEADGQAFITVSRSTGNGTASVDFRTANGTARDGTDYFGVNTTVNFIVSEIAKTVAITVNDDFRANGSRTVNLALSNPVNAEIGLRSNAVLTITDNEIAGAGALAFAVRSNSVPEAGHLATLVVSRTGGTTGTVSIDFATADGTAIAGQNYTATNGTLVFGPGIATKNIVVPIINDLLYESNEVFTVTLSNPQGGAALGTNLTMLVGIINDDFPGVFALKQSAYSITENAGPLVVNVIRTGGAAEGVTVDLFTQDGTAQDGVRYNGTYNTLTFAGGETNKAVNIGIINDLLPNGNQTFFLFLTNATGGAKISTNVLQKMATVTVLDDESSVAFSNATYTVSEGTPTLTVTVVRTGALLTQVAVDFNTADISATAGQDYRATNGTLVFAPNVRSKTFTVSITNDTIVENNEQFLLQLSHPVNGTQLGAQSNAVVTITDNDLGGAISFSATNYIVSEAGTNAAVTLVRSNGLASGVTVDLTLTDNTAVSGVDYSNASPITVTFNANETSKKILVPVINNTIVDGTRIASLSLGNFQGGGSPGARTLATLTITNEDVAGVIAFSRTNYSGFESGTNIYVSVTRTGGKASGVTVDYFTQNGTALDGVRYNATSGTLTFNAGETNKIIAVGLINDTLPNGNQTFNLLLANPQGGATLGKATNAVMTVLDDESSFSLNSPTYVVDDIAGTLTVTVQRSGTLTIPATVTYSETEVTATNRVNFIATNNGVLVFPTNVLSKTFTVPILRDPRVTGPLTFLVWLSNPTGGAQLGANIPATVTINDKDSAGTISFASATFNGTNTSTNAIITIIRTGGLASGAAADFSTANGSASDGVDYTGVITTVTFNAGETNKKVSVPITKKTAIDTDKTVQLTLGNPQGGATIGNGSATLNILEKRTSLGIEQANYSVNKTDGSIAVNLVRSGGISNSVSVVFATASGTAVAPNNYKATNGTVTFAPGVTTKTITIAISNNPALLTSKSFNLKLSGIVGAIYAAVTNATITVAASGSTVAFNSVSYSANKTNANAIVTVVRSGDVSAAASVDLATVDVTANDVYLGGTNGTATTVANDPYFGQYFDPTGYGDYVSVNSTVNFPPGSASQDVPIPLLNNPLGGIRPVDHGSNRWFQCIISNPAGNGLQLGSITNARVNISDTLAHGTIAFGPTNYLGTVSGGTVDLTITRSGGSDGIATAYFNPFRTGDTAFATVDYAIFAANTFNNHVVFGDGETSKVITMTLLSGGGTYPKTSHPRLNTPELLFGATYSTRTNAVVTITP